MRIFAAVVKRAVEKRRRAIGGDAGRPKKRPRPRSPIPPPCEHQTTRETDPLAQSALEGTRGKATSSEMEMAPSETGPTTSEMGPAPEEVPPTEEKAGEEAPTTTEPAAEEAVARGAENEEVPPVSGPTPAILVAVGPTEADELVAIPSQPSLMNHHRKAVQLLARACPPEFREEINRQRAMDIFDDVLVALLWLSIPLLPHKISPPRYILTRIIFMQTVNSMFATRDVALRADAVITHTRRDLSAAQARAEKAEGALESAQAKRTEELLAAQASSREWEAHFEEAKRQAVVELEHTRASEAKLGDVVARLEVHDLQFHTVTPQVSAAKERATDTEAIARMADARAADAEADMRAVMAKVSKMEAVV